MFYQPWRPARNRAEDVASEQPTRSRSPRAGRFFHGHSFEGNDPADEPFDRTMYTRFVSGTD